LGSAILHCHSTYSDGMSSVAALMDELEYHSDVNVVGITDHDDCRSFADAEYWKANHPGSRLQPIWGVELTVFGFTHVLAFKMQPPFPREVPRKFLSLENAVNQLNELGCYVVIPHVDAPVVGMGRRRLDRIAQKMEIFGYELLTPYFTSAESLPELQAIGDRHNLLALGGPDAHFLEDLYRILLDFPGDSVADFESSWLNRTVKPVMGREGPRVTFRRKLEQQKRSLYEHPRDQVRSWVRKRVLDGAS
jgi:predicted metal-dependent phosphoesterase TrpH